MPGLQLAEQRESHAVQESGGKACDATEKLLLRSILVEVDPCMKMKAGVSHC